MTNELIKILILFSLYAVLEIVLFSSSVGRLVSRAVRTPGRHEAHRKSIGRTARDQDAQPVE
ncbi:hypothetical protein [Bradyrhizobium japonicum]|uniref:hypothetical protein n=1 Tax=Bradyrhizobium japonicum TaxID=375 RepID=UPI001BA46592|nr:hypothetical protein [Bradyrhizobium japonicum]MBR0764850.1 hypothetical protein [Bradyrhizobium japonicum]